MNGQDFKVVKGNQSINDVSRVDLEDCGDHVSSTVSRIHRNTNEEK